VTIDGVIHSATGRVVGVHGHDESGLLTISAHHVVGADGLRSRIARAVEAPIIEERGDNGATHYAYFAGDWPAMEYYLADGAFAGVFPTNNGEACVWVCSPRADALRIRQAHDSIDAAFMTMIGGASRELRDRLANVLRTSTVHGMIGMPNHIRRPFGRGWALVGDAGYHRDAITGHGITDAFRDAELLATALHFVLRGAASEAAALCSYQAQRDQQLREVFEITNELATFPPVHRFMDLQKQLSAAIDTQAGILAARPSERLLAA
jgi:flavin-dependent dehydrogenase